MTDISQQRKMIPKCPVCECMDRRHWLNAGGFELVRCAGCGHRYSMQVLAGDLLANSYYSESVHDIASRVNSAKADRFPVYLDMLGRAGRASGRVLDVGCNAGELLHFFAHHGWSIAGIETSPGPAEYARNKLRAPIWQGTVEEVLPDSERFDVITLTHVLEHIVAPVPFLRRLRRAMDDGILLLEVPNANDLLLRFWRGTYRPLCPGDHVSFFDLSSFDLLLGRSGFEVIEVRSPTQARDVIYPSILSAFDYLRHAVPNVKFARSRESFSEIGVLGQARYRGRFREPLRRIIDGFAAAIDPLVGRATQHSRGKGSVLIVTARVAKEEPADCHSLANDR